MAGFRLLLFDIDGVLCTYDRAARCAHLGRRAGLSAEAVHAAIWATGVEDAGDAGSLSDEAYLTAYREKLGYAMTLDEWIEARRVASTPVPSALDLVARLKATGRYRLAALTNNAALMARHIDRICPYLPPLFGLRIFASGQLGAAKPAAASYLRCLERLGETPAATLFIDDKPDNVLGAEAAGLAAALCETPEALAGVLAERGILRP